MKTKKSENHAVHEVSARHMTHVDVAARLHEVPGECAQWQSNRNVMMIALLNLTALIFLSVPEHLLLGEAERKVADSESIAVMPHGSDMYENTSWL